MVPAASMLVAERVDHLRTCEALLEICSMQRTREFRSRKLAKALFMTGKGGGGLNSMRRLRSQRRFQGGVIAYEYPANGYVVSINVQRVLYHMFA